MFFFTIFAMLQCRSQVQTTAAPRLHPALMTTQTRHLTSSTSWRSPPSPPEPPPRQPVPTDTLCFCGPAADLKPAGESRPVARPDAAGGERDGAAGGELSVTQCPPSFLLLPLLLPRPQTCERDTCHQIKRVLVWWLSLFCVRVLGDGPALSARTRH